MANFEADRDMEMSERQKLENEIRAKQEEIEMVKQAVDAKDEETRKLQEEMAEAKRQLEATTVSMNQRMQEASEVTEAAIVSNGLEDSMTSSSSSSSEDEIVHTKPDEERDIDATKEALLKVLLTINFKYDMIIYEKYLKELRKNLETVKDESKLTEADRQYKLISDQGRDKFKTLRDIRSGNTKRRIDNFENM